MDFSVPCPRNSSRLIRDYDIMCRCSGR